MSSFMVTATTMQHVVAGILNAHRDRTKTVLMFNGNTYRGIKGFTDLGNELLEMNGLALKARYGNSDPAPAFRFDAGLLLTQKLPEHYKAIQCFLYQCGEGDVPESPLFQAVDEAAGLLARRFIEQSAAYENAPWGHFDPAPAPVAVAVADKSQTAEVVAINTKRKTQVAKAPVAATRKRATRRTGQAAVAVAVDETDATGCDYDPAEFATI